MNAEENILEQFQALQLGPVWTEKSRKTIASTNGTKTKKASIIKEKQAAIANRVSSSVKALEQVIDINLRPEESALKVLINTLRSSCKTYQLFPLIHLFLEKEDRFFIVLNGRQSSSFKGFYVVSKKIPFLSMEGALDYVVHQNWAQYFKEECVVLEKPKGNFQSVNRCGITGALLGPPNYHLYADLLREHYEGNLKGRCAYESFLSQIKNERTAEVVEAWLTCMTQGRRFRLLADPEVCFMSKEAAKKYLLENSDLNLTKKVFRVKLTVSDVGKIVDFDLRKMIEKFLNDEKKLPVKTANFFRGRLHYAGFHIYKKGRNGISYVCAIKRKIRNTTTQFSESVSKLIEVIEKYEGKITIFELPKVFFNVTDSAWEAAVDPRSAREFKSNLSWLIREGYVTEFEDNTLYVSPVQNLQKSILTSEKEKVL
ncbi:MAG: hypothetical protein LBD69_00265 [Puniceicoccales bacterium]|nr:hypothetical protein [Puniceicoccales bacterium]